MRSVIAGCLVAVLLSLASMPARAYITLDAIVPESPVAGEFVSARISAGICDSIIDEVGYPQISQSGNAVRMLIETTYYDDPILCNSDPGTLDMAFGSFPAGAYTLQLDRRYVDLSGVVIETVGARAFVVEAAPAAIALPTSSLASLLVLGLSILLVGVLCVRGRSLLPCRQGRMALHVTLG